VKHTGDAHSAAVIAFVAVLAVSLAFSVKEAVAQFPPNPRSAAENVDVGAGHSKMLASSWFSVPGKDRGRAARWLKSSEQHV
jgi:hypothetical protein